MVALAVLAASASLVAAGVAADTGLQATPDWPREPSGEYDHDASEHNGTETLNVTVGAQLSTVIETRANDVRTDVADAGFSLAYERGDREGAVGDRFEELRDRAAGVHEDYRDLEADYDDGDISRGEYARRLATLHDEARQLRRSLARVRVRAETLSASARADAGITETALDGIAEDLDAVESTGHRALLARYTGHGHGRFEVDLDAGVRIEARNGDGEGFRSVRRSGDDSREVTVDRDEASETARDALSSEWNWTLEAESLDEIDGEYHFEFSLDATDEVGGAEVLVDGSSGEIVDLEEGAISLEGDREWWSIGDRWDDSERNGEDEDRGPDWIDDDDHWLDPDHEWDRNGSGRGWLTPDHEWDRDNDSRDRIGDDGEHTGWLDPGRDDASDRENATDPGDATGPDGIGDDDRRGWLDPDDEDDGDDGSAGDGRPWNERRIDADDGFNVSVTGGQVRPGETVTVTVRVDGNATADVPVSVNGEDTGETDSDGRLTVTLPDAEAIELRAEWDGLEAELEYEFDEDDRGFWGR